MTALRFGLVDLGRNPVLLVLLLIVPAVFVLLSKATTPARPLAVTVTENGATAKQLFWFPEIHAGAMAPIGIGMKMMANNAALAAVRHLIQAENVVASSERSARHEKLIMMISFAIHRFSYIQAPPSK